MSTATTDASLDIADPQPGIYYGVPASVYHAIDACSHSRLCQMRRSAAHCRYAMDNDHQTPDMLLGEAAHVAILQLELFERTYAVAPECDRRTTVGKAIYVDFMAGSRGKIVLTQDQSAAIAGMMQAINKHSSARAAVGAADAVEVSILWHDPETGILCKARLDMLLTAAGCITDLKTTNDAGPDFADSIGKWGYHIQAGFYLYGCERNGIDVKDFAILSVEKEPPHGVAVYQLDEEAIAYGNREWSRLIRLYAKCKETNVWPGYGEGVNYIGLSKWHKDKITRAEGNTL